jgi:hypothetical protein
MNKSQWILLWHPQEEMANIHFDICLNKDIIKMEVMGKWSISSYFGNSRSGFFEERFLEQDHECWFYQHVLFLWSSLINFYIFTIMSCHHIMFFRCYCPSKEFHWFPVGQYIYLKWYFINKEQIEIPSKRKKSIFVIAPWFACTSELFR